MVLQAHGVMTFRPCVTCGNVLQPLLPLFPSLTPSLPDCVLCSPPVTGGLPLQYQVEYVPRLIR